MKRSDMIFICFIGVIIFLMFTINFSAMIYYNSLESPLDRTYTGGGYSSSEGGKIEDYVIEGAAYFLNSYSNSLLVLTQAELSEWDLNESKGYIETAIKSMKNAINRYENLNKRVGRSSYDEIKIEILKNFNYDRLQKDKGLIKPIFDDMRSYLSIGDIRGVCKKMLNDSNYLLSKLKGIQKKLNRNVFPESEVWDLSHYFVESSLFGQYVAMVFYEIIRKQKVEVKK